MGCVLAQFIHDICWFWIRPFNDDHRILLPAPVGPIKMELRPNIPSRTKAPRSCNPYIWMSQKLCKRFVTRSRPKCIFGSRHSYYTVRCPKPYCTCRASIGSFFRRNWLKHCAWSLASVKFCVCDGWLGYNMKPHVNRVWGVACMVQYQYGSIWFHKQTKRNALTGFCYSCE